MISLNPLDIHLEKAFDTTVEALLQALELRDRDTAAHSIRTTFPAIQLGLGLGLNEEEIAGLRWGLLLHDIGKLGIPDALLLKPGPLSAEERSQVQQHPELAYRALSRLDFPRSVVEIAYCHHENWDGSGYPHAMKGKNIPMAARIAALAETWDSLTNNQPYRWAWSQSEAFAYVIEKSGIMFDPQVVRVFKSLYQD